MTNITNLSPARQDPQYQMERQTCEAALVLVLRGAPPQTLWDLLDECQALVPVMQDLLHERSEEDLLADLIYRYYADLPFYLPEQYMVV